VSFSRAPPRPRPYAHPRGPRYLSFRTEVYYFGTFCLPVLGTFPRLIQSPLKDIPTSYAPGTTEIMRIRTVDHCNAEIILNANVRLKQEIVEVMQTINCAWGRPEAPPHRYIQEAFKQRGWKSEVLVSNRTFRKHYFDLYKDRVAIEIELSSREMLYRDYFRFLLAEQEGMIDVGVIITWDPRPEMQFVEPARAGQADLQQVQDDLSWMRNWLRIPIWVIGVS
jgi:hypothetical protein